MKLLPYTIEQLAPFIVNVNSGRSIIKLFGNYGVRDIYDDVGLPDIGKRSGQRPSKTEYVIKRLSDLNDSHNLRDLINFLINARPEIKTELESILNPDGYGIVETEGIFKVQGGIITNAEPVINEAHFQDIQSRILRALDSAEVSITLMMAWFTNDVLFRKIVEKYKAGLDIKFAIYDDGINRKHGVDVSQIPHVKMKKGLRGGIMHNKFCVIDNQIVITGSYNWSDNAEFKNDENVTIEYDPKQATKYSVEFRRLTQPAS